MSNDYAQIVVSTAILRWLLLLIMTMIAFHVPASASTSALFVSSCKNERACPFGTTTAFSHHQANSPGSIPGEDEDDDDGIEESSIDVGHYSDIARIFLKNFNEAWQTSSGENLCRNFFVDDSSSSSSPVKYRPFWRDMVAFTWNIVTQEGTTSIQQAIDDHSIQKQRAQSTFLFSENDPLPLQYHHHGHNDGRNILEFWANIDIKNIGSGKAHFRLLSSNTITRDPYDDSHPHGTWRIHTMLTTLQELHEQPFQVGHTRIKGHQFGPIRNRDYWPEYQQKRHKDPYVVIIGGGQAGLALGARVQHMNVPYIILEAGDQPGIAWRKRYPSLHLHDPVWYNHMPYLPFPETWPIFCPRDKIADWLEMYAKVLDLNVQLKSRVQRIYRHNGSWNVEVHTTSDDDDGQNDPSTTPSPTKKKEVISAAHVVLATGNSSKPKIPNIPGTFLGTQIHSSQYQGGRKYAGKRIVVVGSNNSGWDVVQDLWEQGAAKVTMIQRSPSMVVSTNSVLTHGLGSLYRQNASISHENADLIATSTPYKLMIPKWQAVTKKMQETDRGLLEGLEAAGYHLDDGPDGAGVFAKSATEGGGFYIDMGCADLVIRKKVEVRYANILRLENDRVVIRDKKSNEEAFLKTQVIIYATGFETMDKWMAQLCGEDMAAKIGRTWGLGYGNREKDPGPWEGELRNMWKPTNVEGLWFHGGNLAQCRHYSRFLALQLAARRLELTTCPYGIPSPTRSARKHET